MEQFNPVLNIVAVDDSDAVVTFDFASASDMDRAPRVLRIPRKFSQLSVTVLPFESNDELGGEKEYRGTIKLVLESLEGAPLEYVLAEPRLWLAAESRNRKKGVHAFNYHTTEAVTRAVRVGVANALSHALASFYNNENYIDTMARVPTHPVAASPALPVAEGRPAPGRLAAAFQTVKAPSAAANDDDASKSRFRKKVIIAAIASPLLVYTALSVGSAMKRDDPIHAAVAKAMAQDPQSTQAQVELTKETLKQMGLDPGKAADLGCLAPQ